MNEHTERIEQLKSRITQIPFAKLLGVVLRSFEPGICVLEVPAKEALLRTSGIFNGGVITSLADMSAGYAVAATGRSESDYYVTTDLHTTFLRKSAGDKLIAKAEVIKSGLTVSVVHVHIYVNSIEEEKLTAVSTVSFMKIK